MKRLFFVRSRLALIMTLAVIALATLAGCEPTAETVYTHEQAVKELGVLKGTIKSSTVTPQLDIYSLDDDASSALAPLSSFPTPVVGSADIVIEIAAGTEKSSGKHDADSWFDQMAEQFNKANHTVNGKSVAVTIRTIIAGDGLTYITEAGYRPDGYAPANSLWGGMLSAKGIEVITVAERTAGNTAGILMEKQTYDAFTAKSGDLTMDKVLEAALAGDFLFAYTNPFTSDTGLNMFTAMLHSFDNSNPLSEQAAAKLLDYQKTAPPVAYSTEVMREQAAKGIIKAMVMERQAYINTPQLQDYIYSPEGIRHDNPVYTFGWVDEERREVLDMFLDLCLSPEGQKVATECGFNQLDEYVPRPSGLDGAGLLAAQKLWKQNKDGGMPVIGLFVADTSGSMDGRAIKSLQQALISASSYIGSGNYIGLISYSDTVTVNLPIAEFDDTQRAYFTGAVKSLMAGGNTATYDAVLVGLDMLLQKQAEVPDAKVMLFVLSDGAQNSGYSLGRITPIVGGLRVPVYGIEFNSSETDLSVLSRINEAVTLKADSEDLINQLRNLFNVQM